jgi:hypothetical protein
MKLVALNHAGGLVEIFERLQCYGLHIGFVGLWKSQVPCFEFCITYAICYSLCLDIFNI